jgi:NAD(P)-dependent dehydrogenase (short-subunit alcohol dehydrogenase family)
MNHEKTAIISGGAGGVGRAVGAALARAGFDVVLLYRSTPAADVERIIKDFASGRHLAFRCDVRDEAAVESACAAIFKEYATVNAIIHAAVAPIARMNASELNDAVLTDQLGAALFGGLHLVKGALPYLQRSGGGSIVGVLSRYLIADSYHQKMGGYVIAKYALWGFLKELSRELGPEKKITVNALAPDFLDTNLSGDLPAPVRAFIKERGTSGSMRSLDSVAQAVSFLCSPAGTSVHGTIYALDRSEIRPL